MIKSVAKRLMSARDGQRLSAFVLTLAFALVAAAFPATASEETFCARQYQLEDHLIMEWAALGGDPHAQLALAQCALPTGVNALTPSQKTYAVKWVTIANCEAADEQFVADRNKRTRKLKEDGVLSYRRFDASMDNERFTTKEKMFQAYRARRKAELRERHKALTSVLTAREHRDGLSALSDELARMGPLGLVRLSELSECAFFAAPETRAAASWSAAGDAWSGSYYADIVGKSDRRNWSVAKEGADRYAALEGREAAAASFEKERLTRTAPSRLRSLEKKAALADLDQMRTPLAHTGEEGATEGTVTGAVQYALASLGRIDFVNGPDDDYGPTTIEAVKRHQAAIGASQTRWLSHQQALEIICEAADKKNDPVSLYNVAQMYANGWGLPRNLARARDAIDRAQTSITSALTASAALPDWRRQRYPVYDALIKSEKQSIEAAWRLLPAQEKNAAVSSLTLCQ